MQDVLSGANHSRASHTDKGQYHPVGRIKKHHSSFPWQWYGHGSGCKTGQYQSGKSESTIRQCTGHAGTTTEPAEIYHGLSCRRADSLSSGKLREHYACWVDRTIRKSVRTPTAAIAKGHGWKAEKDDWSRLYSFIKPDRQLDVLRLYGQGLPLVPLRTVQPLVPFLRTGRILTRSYIRRTG